MSNATTNVNSLDVLRSYVHERLCRHENLVAEQFGLDVTPLTRKGALWEPSGRLTITCFTCTMPGVNAFIRKYSPSNSTFNWKRPKAWFR